MGLYPYHSALVQPRHRPALMPLTNGQFWDASLDWSGLCPESYYMMQSATAIMAAEVGVMDVPHHDMESRAQVSFRMMLLTDFGKVADERLGGSLEISLPSSCSPAHL
jgi:hypothetical protein